MSADSVLQSTGLDILSVVVEFNPSMVREFILSDAQQMQSQNDVCNAFVTLSSFLYCLLCRLAPCVLRGCKIGPAPFPGRMLYKATKPGLAVCHILACFYCVIVY